MGLATAVDMFMQAAFSLGLALFLYNAPTVELYDGWILEKNMFFVIFNIFNMLGGLSGRIVSYFLRPRHPIYYTVFSFSGMCLMLLRKPVLAPISTYLIMLGNGLIYGTISKHIDSNVPRWYNLIAISIWLCIGDVGSIVGSNLL